MSFPIAFLRYYDDPHEDAFVRLERHLQSLQRHLELLDLRGEAAAVRTDLELLAEARRSA
jgi:hypothetical protein